MDEQDANRSFLTVEEAARRLGTTRLRVREAVALSLLEARRDNEGRLRVDLPDGQTLIPGKSSDLEPEAILTFLFDDIEELEAGLAERDARIAALSDLLARQDAALARTDDLLAALQDDKARLAAMLDRAFSHLDAAEARETRLQKVSDRAMEAVELALMRAEGEAANGERLAALVARAMSLAEQGAEAHGVADRSLDLLENALASAEAAQAAQKRGDVLLGRSMDAAEAAQDVARDRGEKLAAREQTLEKTLALSERAAALAENTAIQPRKGFLRRLFGL